MKIKVDFSNSEDRGTLFKSANVTIENFITLNGLTYSNKHYRKIDIDNNIEDLIQNGIDLLQKAKSNPDLRNDLNSLYLDKIMYQDPQIEIESED